MAKYPAVFFFYLMTSFQLYWLICIFKLKYTLYLKQILTLTCCVFIKWILTLIILFQMGCIIYTDKGFVSTALYCEEKASMLNKALNNGYFTCPSASKSTQWDWCKFILFWILQVLFHLKTLAWFTITMLTTLCINTKVQACEMANSSAVTFCF